MIEKFKANGKAELNIDVEKTSKEEHSVVELPVDCSKYNLDKAS